MDPLEIWPTFGLRITTPRLELRAMTPDLVWPMIELADSGIHDPDTMPFTVPWTDASSPERQRDSLRHYWNMFATFLGLTPDLDALPVNAPDEAGADR